MNLRLQRAIDRYAGVPLCALFSFFHFFRLRRRAAPARPRTILVILLSEMGSLVLAHAMFARVRQRYPDARVHALVFAKNREVLDLLRVIPEENVLTVSDDSLPGFVGDSLKVLAAMRSLKFDAVIDCELFARVSSLFSYLSGAALRAGFHRHNQEGLYRGSFINRPVLYNPYRHLSQQFVTLVEALESESVPLAKHVVSAELGPPPAVAFAREELEQAAARLHADFPAIAGKSLVLVNPGGGILPIRAWPLEHYFRLCAELLRDGHAVGVTGLAEDKPLGRAITGHCASPLCVDLTGYTRSVRQLLALFHRASLLVTNDGGPGQFAALTPIPVLVFFGPETPALYGPLSRNAHCFHLSLPCSPCLTAYNHRASPCDGDNQCLKRIAPEQALAKARELLGTSPLTHELHRPTP
jgi:ADP-heptose:LPS heptosyltransferase